MTATNIVGNQVSQFAHQLIDHGIQVGPFLPWHRSRDPYNLLVAESLLRLTTRKKALEAYNNLLGAYPAWSSLAFGTESEIAGRIAISGLANQRAKQLKKLAVTILQDWEGMVPRTRERLLALPGVGNYTADATLLYVFQRRVLPIDSNLQRVFRRVLGLPVPIGTRRSDPYRDNWVQMLVKQLTGLYTSTQLANLHRGALDIAWKDCRFRPIHIACPLIKICQTAQFAA